MSRSAFPAPINVIGPSITTSAFSTGPPANATDGDIWIASGVDSNGTRWQFQYNAGSASTYKWEFIGGPPTVLESNAAVHNTLANTPQETDTALRFVCQRAGDYQAAWYYQVNDSGTGIVVQAGVMNASVGTGTAVMSATTTAVANGYLAITRAYLYTGVGAGQTLSGVTQTSNATPANTSFYNRTVAYLPVRVS